MKAGGFRGSAKKLGNGIHGKSLDLTCTGKKITLLL